jgi:hypothetical protein
MPQIDSRDADGHPHAASQREDDNEGSDLADAVGLIAR